MMEKFKFFLDWALPIMCLLNLYVYWGDANLTVAWIVAFAGWGSNLINRYKQYDNN